MFTIAHNVYLNSARRATCHTILDDNVEDDRPNSLSIVEGRSELRVVLQALQQLPPLDRAALLIRMITTYFGDSSSGRNLHRLNGCLHQVHIMKLEESGSIASVQRCPTARRAMRPSARSAAC